MCVCPNCDKLIEWVNRRTIIEQKATKIFAKQIFRTFINNQQLFARSSPTSGYVSFCGMTASNKVIKVIVNVKLRLQFTAWLMVVKKCWCLTKCRGNVSVKNAFICNF